MKKLILILVMVLGTMSCGTKSDTAGADTNVQDCTIPKDIPDTLCDGTPVYWDCSWDASYRNGDVFVVYNDDGTAKYIGRYLDKKAGESW